MLLNNNIDYPSLPVLSTKSIQFESDNRFSNMMLFPISGAKNTEGAGTYSVIVQARRNTSDDDLKIFDDKFCMTVTEVQN